jgi:4'-phosphopantetheinyl transferase
MNIKKVRIFGLDNLNQGRVLAADDIHLWLVNIKHKFVEDNFCKLYDILDLKEKEIFGRYILEEHRRRFVCSRGILKKLVANYLNIEINDIFIKYNDKGKPFLDNSVNYINLNFNISHSNELLIIVFTLESLIGADIEYIDKSRDIMGISKRFFNINEYNYINRYKGDEQFKIFYIFWTFKEALLKCCGMGITCDFHNITLPLTESKIFENLEGIYKYCNKIWNYNILEICNKYIINIVYG